MFTLDTDSGFRDVVFITASYGLGETVVQGAVNPDEFYLYKPALRAGKQAVLRRNLGGKAIKMVYASAGIGRARAAPCRDSRRPIAIRFCSPPMPISCSARPPGTGHRAALPPADGHRMGQGRGHRRDLHPPGPPGDGAKPRRPYDPTLLAEGARARPQPTGRSIGQKIGAGTGARDPHRSRTWTASQPGDVLVADMTDPDWEPVMKRAAAIVTNRGGRTCHAAIIARELGVPAVVGSRQRARAIPDGTEVTVSCAEGDTGYVYAGLLEYERVTARPRLRCRHRR
jgi:pyruvate,water dikinase